ncbi:putative RNA-binding protein [Wickerhamomyces ciferrii]|uniref:RNA-binding protein n=1 Tax=Wickerhamomyces ciferrii (strain ATCC 14091 / BCRC 22168 / CBS 111 / JCM 3599 / NBRC 0793 / NRRL Y-1031 F-60-10) TaxID=1206466 RepID=K0KN24_WICCF|nr:putative RNA-binding protein [Wickerhamomyces ciferrii]CCH46665.1 putative RNA-binding protein [Wickerhamomyces ciferrii]
MSLSDDEEALFDDIYGDEDQPKDEVKKEEETKESEADVKKDDDKEDENKDESKEESKDATKENTPSTDTKKDDEENSTSNAPTTTTSNQETSVPSTSESINESKTESNISSNPNPSSQHKVDLSRDAAKMFIGGLDWDTSEERLKEYFSKFGEVIDHTIMRESSTGRSRGFGFLTFAEPRSVDEVVKTEHVLDGKVIDPKRAIPRDEQDKTGKIFVGGIAPEVRPKEFENFFGKFGTIIDAQLMLDKDTGRSRGFGFVTFDAPDAVDRVCQGRYLDFNGRQIEVKRAEPRGPQQQQNHIQQQQQRYLQQQGFGGAGYQQHGGAGFPNANPYGAGAAAAVPGAQPGMPAGGAAYGGVTPEAMTQYWQQMQAYWLQFQQQAQQSGSNISQQDLQALASQLQQQQGGGQIPQIPQSSSSNDDGLPNSVPPPPPSDSYNDGGYGNYRRRGGPPNAPRGPRGRGRGRGGYNRNNGGGYHPYQRN